MKERRQMRKNTKKRMLSLFLAASMLVSSVDMTAFAAGANGAENYAENTEEPAFETAAPETTAPETAAPETAAPETTAPETAAPETTAPETAAPETTAPETAAQETTVPETTAASEESAAPGQSDALDTQTDSGELVIDDAGELIIDTEEVVEIIEGTQTAEETEVREEIGETEEETMDALLAVSWYDKSDEAGKRPVDIRDLLNVYADDELLDNYTLEIVLLNTDEDGDGEPDPDTAYGLETYYVDF